MFDVGPPYEQAPNTCAAGVVEPTTSLDSGESTVELPRGSSLSAASSTSYQLSQPFRHSDWSDDRERVYRALRAAHGACSRTAAFSSCGTGGFVLRSRDNPSHFKIVGNHCHDRFCQPCQRDRSNNIRVNVAPLIANQRHRFLTLTMRASSEPLRLQIDALLKHFRRLRHSKLWRTTIAGGVALIELKYNPKACTWHPHVHCIVHGRFIPQTELSALWMRITEDSYIVDVRMIRNPHDALGLIVKYATKRIAAEIIADPDRLAEAIIALTGRKLCIGFGDWATVKFTDTPSDESWDYVGALCELPSLARQGNTRAIAAMAAINHRYYTDHVPNKGPPPTSTVLYDAP